MFTPFQRRHLLLTLFRSSLDTLSPTSTSRRWSSGRTSPAPTPPRQTSSNSSSRNSPSDEQRNRFRIQNSSPILNRQTIRSPSQQAISSRILFGSAPSSGKGQRQSYRFFSKISLRYNKVKKKWLDFVGLANLSLWPTDPQKCCWI